jgi:hypothetical protein
MTLSVFENNTKLFLSYSTPQLESSSSSNNNEQRVLFTSTSSSSSCVRFAFENLSLLFIGYMFMLPSRALHRLE